ncbi:hypothetical protein EYE40_00270 [Glaciihabitans arcticus]|uniref:Uncharacterized protein n=1 Tax=Glaciihabitans arcticus TaxID=2668039 RepID=A0A4Q9GMU3_9MICO|nr:hypothetical protein [Glaciihabitans arcticus]TBN55955.1 hypothetical protein EYE40_00270 [Glaciihabitans arcticus]
MNSRPVTTAPQRRASSPLEPFQLLHSVGAILRDDGRLKLKHPSAVDLSRGEETMLSLLRANLVTRDEALYTPRWKDRAIRLLAARSASAVEHGPATTELLEIIAGLTPRRQSANKYFALARATSAIGLFEASYGFTELAYDRVDRDARMRPDLRNRLKSVLVALHRQDRDLAIERWAPLEGASPTAASTLRLHRAIGRYMSVWAPDVFGPSPVRPGSDRWRSDLAGKKLVMVGPAPTEIDYSDLTAFDYVVRILRGPSLHLPAVVPPPGREILYSATGWYKTFATYDAAELEHRFGSFVHFVVKGRPPSLAAPLANMRVTDNDYRLLFFHGSPNMVPVAAFDILEAGDVSLHVVGTNFYASKEPYAPGSVNGLHRYEMTRSLANHNPLENRAFVANLVTSGAITGDQQLTEVVRLSDLEYLRILDEHFGAPQR